MIGIITVFYSENCGSVLQAYALAKFLHDCGYDIKFVSTKNHFSSHSLFGLLRRIINQLAHFNIDGLKSVIRCYNSFSKIIKKYFTYEDFYKLLKKKTINTFIIGSDTVWDVDRKRFTASSDIFWPQCKKTKIIVYGASVANSTIERMKELKYPEKSLEIINAISVRDKYSYNVISSLTDNKVHLVCDPTLLVPSNYFDCFKISRKNYNCSEYIALYLFESLNNNSINDIIAFARYNNYKIISIGKKVSWSDKNVDATIENFITYISNSKYVITNTFHGTVFSIIYNKKFISLASNKRKVVELLDEFKLKRRLCFEEKNICNILCEDIDYMKVNKYIEKVRKKSSEYLINNLAQ